MPPSPRAPFRSRSARRFRRTASTSVRRRSQTSPAARRVPPPPAGPDHLPGPRRIAIASTRRPPPPPTAAGAPATQPPAMSCRAALWLAPRTAFQAGRGVRRQQPDLRVRGSVNAAQHRVPCWKKLRTVEGHTGTAQAPSTAGLVLRSGWSGRRPAQRMATAHLARPREACVLRPGATWPAGAASQPPPQTAPTEELMLPMQLRVAGSQQGHPLRKAQPCSAPL
jgi:hypothetical protein